MDAAVLAAVDVRKRFGALPVLDGVSLELRPGEVVGVVGPNGAGKTTLLNVLAGAIPPDSGTIRFAGRDVTARGAADRCKMGVARTHQVPRPFTGMTVFENVLSPRPRAAARAAPRPTGFASASWTNAALPPPPTGGRRASACSSASGWSSRARSLLSRPSSSSTRSVVA
jgi:ABC-type branched-subunit amino acid transport system ATPase component